MKAAPPVEAKEETMAMHMLIEKSLVKQIEDYRFQYRYPTRIEAVKALIRYGLTWVSTNTRKMDKRGS
jgi:hypothetical protein